MKQIYVVNFHSDSGDVSAEWIGLYAHQGPARRVALGAVLRHALGDEETDRFRELLGAASMDEALAMGFDAIEAAADEATDGEFDSACTETYQLYGTWAAYDLTIVNEDPEG